MAFDREGRRQADALRADVASLAVRLEPVAGQRILLHCEDAYAFSVGLVASAQVGACAVLPPSRQPGALRRLLPEVAALLLDGDAPEQMEGRPCWHPLEAPPASRALEALDREAVIVELFTSGTTGGEKPVSKSVRHLEDEVRVLEECFGSVLGAGTRVLATMAPQHLYGLLFRVLWPLAAARPFLRPSLLHPEEFKPHLNEAAPFVLATTPAPLRHLLDKRVLATAAGACRAVFSSGGPLDAALARRVAQAVGAPPIEVYGSTETGGVAIRQRWRGDELWHPLPGVEVEPDPGSGCLVVTSRFVSCGELRPDGRARFVLGDRVAFAAGGGFQLLGRTDRVVKIGEKRLSLPEMEQRLRSHAAVADAALVSLDPGADARIGAVVVPTPTGREILATGGRRALTKTLTEHLAPDFDRVLLPRAWRVVDALPRDPQGKTPVGRLRAILAGPGGAPRVYETLAVRRQERGVEVDLCVPRDSAFLEGHFPSQPVVAGVVQVHFAMAALEEFSGVPPRLECLEALKFRELLRPGETVRLHLRWSEDGARFEFTLADPERPGRVFSSGRGRLGQGS